MRELRGVTKLDNKGAYSASCWVRGGYWHGRFPIVHSHLGNGANAQAKPEPELNSAEPGQARSYRVDCWRGPVDPKPTRRQPQTDVRQTQAGVRQTQIHANFFQQLPIAVLSLFKGLAAIARGTGVRPCGPLLISQKTHMAAVLFRPNLSPRPFASPRGAPPLARLRFLTSASI